MGRVIVGRVIVGRVNGNRKLSPITKRTTIFYFLLHDLDNRKSNIQIDRSLFCGFRK